MQALPTLVFKALVDSGYELLQPLEDGWYLAAVSGSPARVAVKVIDADTLLAVPEPDVMERIGLQPAANTLPAGMASVGVAESPVRLYEALRLLHSLQVHPGPPEWQSYHSLDTFPHRV